jgi:hypothetical protein
MSDETPYPVQPQPFASPKPQPNPYGVPPSTDYTHQQPMPGTYPSGYATPGYVNPTVTVIAPTIVGTPPLSSSPQHLSMILIFNSLLSANF